MGDEPMKIAVLLGGSSEERAVSLASGVQVAAALRSKGHHVVSIDAAVGVLSSEREEAITAAGILKPDDPAVALPSVPEQEPGLPEARVILSEPALRDVDVVFIALHGGAGEDGTVQTLLELAGLPYVGSGPVASALTMDKDLSKRLLRDGGVLTPAWLSGIISGEEVIAQIGSPVIVKPQSGGSSVRLTLARTAGEVDAASQDAIGGGDVVMYEAFVKGREFTVGVLDGKALPVVEIIPEHELFDYECKYEAGMAQEIVPARIDDELTRGLQDLALRSHAILGLEHYSRIDFIVDVDDNIWCLEANNLPGLTANSLLPKAAQAAGIDVGDLCERLALFGAQQGPRRRNPSKT